MSAVCRSPSMAATSSGIDRHGSPSPAAVMIPPTVRAQSGKLVKGVGPAGRPCRSQWFTKAAMADAIRSRFSCTQP